MSRIFVIALLLVAVLGVYAPPASTQAVGNATFEVVNPPADGVLHLAVGESYTFEVRVTSDVEFQQAILMPDQYYPGRGVFFNGRDAVRNNTEATLYITVTGKSSTADLEGGAAPISLVVGARYGGGQVVSQVFSYVVVVP